MNANAVVACDPDQDAIRIAAQARASVHFFAGSAAAVRSDWADLIVANIDSATLELLTPEFARIRKPESVLILSGFPNWDTPEGFNPKEILDQEGWVCWIA